MPHLNLSKTITLCLGALIMSFLVGYLVFAWTEPTAAPPGGNVSAPLNVSLTAQTKAGGLILNTGGAPNGLIVDQGNVGIGTQTPGVKLDVAGNSIRLQRSTEGAVNLILNPKTEQTSPINANSSIDFNYIDKNGALVLVGQLEARPGYGIFSFVNSSPSAAAKTTFILGANEVMRITGSLYTPANSIGILDVNGGKYTYFKAGSQTANITYTLPTAQGVANTFLRNDGSGTLSWIAAGAGSVTSVGLSAPPEFTVSGSPVTASGTLALSKANQNANLVYAGPTSGAAAAPTFRALVAADIPSLDVAKITTGTFTVVRGGTGLSALGSANQLLGVNPGATGLEYKTLSGISNQITVTNTTGSITLSTPQNINTGASPTFFNLTLSNNLTVGGKISGKMFGSWDASKVTGTVYQAATDGFVVANVEALSPPSASGGWAYVHGYTGGSNPPTMRTASAEIDWISATRGTFFNSFTMPVRKGDYWEVIYNTGGVTQAVVYWIPLGD